MRLKLKLKNCVAGVIAGLVFSSAAYAAEKTYTLDFDASDYTVQTMQAGGKEITFRAYTDRVYVANPVDAEYQKLNLYIPEAYFRGESMNGYTARTAPIFLPNGVGGYMPGRSAVPDNDKRHGGGANASLTALSRGCVVAAPAIRGRTLKDADGKNTGKAPAFIVDYKAAVRWLRHNKERLPAGDTEKIISNGTSAGGALSALLGAVGNAEDYAPYLKEIGAADERDDIFAAMAYCPITDLDHADEAYEWVFNGVNEYHQRKMTLPPASAPKPEDSKDRGVKSNRPENAPTETVEAVLMTEIQRRTSDELKALFPAYVNSLNLKDKNGNPLTLDENGRGTFRDFVEAVYLASAQSALDKGDDLSKLDWLTVKDNRAVSMDLHKYALWATRMKAAPAFDALDNSSGENNEFGTVLVDNQHFTDYAKQHSTVDAPMADKKIIKLMNPLYYIGAEKVSTARHWRIRHGAVDRDTALAIPAILALKLMNNGCTVDFASPWGYGHDGDYDLEELFNWIDSICKTEK